MPILGQIHKGKSWQIWLPFLKASTIKDTKVLQDTLEENTRNI